MLVVLSSFVLIYEHRKVDDYFLSWVSHAKFSVCYVMRYSYKTDSKLYVKRSSSILYQYQSIHINCYFIEHFTVTFRITSLITKHLAIDLFLCCVCFNPHFLVRALPVPTQEHISMVHSNQFSFILFLFIKFSFYLCSYLSLNDKSI